MKPILIACASLVAAGAAFGFAKVVDHMSSAPELRTPSAAMAVERVMPDTTSPYIAAAPRLMSPTSSISTGPTIPAEAEAELATIANIPVAPAAGIAAAERTNGIASAPALLPDIPRGSADAGNSMSFLPAGTSLVDDAQAPTRYEFGALPLIGVYR